ncbi:hypothetical protein [Nonomuraea sp. NPDC050405]|uniref:hypothetical protein n=1 Tax=Nonomuraea sp. NPDC050405 TaxID=3154509 RepID=UPI0033E8CE73
MPGSQAAIAGLPRLWRLTTGDERVTVAVVDGLVEQDHPALAGVKLSELREVWPGGPASGRTVRRWPACCSAATTALPSGWRRAAGR